MQLLLKAQIKLWVILTLRFHQKKISPHIAVFTNFYPDHLNYYKNLEDYFYDKQAIFQYQKKEDYLLVNLNLKKISSASPAINFSKKDFPTELTYLKGDHNLVLLAPRVD